MAFIYGSKVFYHSLSNSSVALGTGLIGFSFIWVVRMKVSPSYENFMLTIFSEGLLVRAADFLLTLGAATLESKTKSITLINKYLFLKKVVLF